MILFFFHEDLHGMLNDMGRFHHSRAWSFDAGVSYRYGQPVKESELLQFQCFVSLFGFPLPYDWSKKIVPPVQPIRCKTKSSRDSYQSSHWPLAIFSYLVIDPWDYFGLSRKH